MRTLKFWGTLSNWRKLVSAACASLEHENLEVLGNIEQLAQVGLRRVPDLHEFLATVRHLRNSHSRAVPVLHLPGRLVQDLHRHHARASREVKDPVIGERSLLSLGAHFKWKAGKSLEP